MATHERQPHQVQAHTTDQSLYAHAGDRSIVPQQGPSKSKLLAVMALLPVGGALLGLAGITLAGTMIALACATPLLIIFSPVLVPAAVTVTAGVTGFLASGTFGLTGLSSMSFLSRTLRQVTRSVPEQIELAKRRMQDFASYTGQKTKDIGQSIHDKGREIRPDQHRRHDQGGDRREVGGDRAGLREEGMTKGKLLVVMALLPVGGATLGLAGIVLICTLIGVACATPLFIIFSPILVPAVLTIALAVAGFLTSGTIGLTGLSSLSFLLNSLRQAAGTVPEQIDHAKMMMQDLGVYTGQKTKEIGQAIEDKGHEIGAESQGQSQSEVRVGGKEGEKGRG